MIISVINHTGGEISDGKVHEALRIVNRQIKFDFEPYWSLGAMLRLEGKSTTKPETIELRDMRGDAVLYLWNGSDVDNAVGYHEANNRGIPFGFVFTKLAKELGESWTVTLSHEALELIADPEVNLLVQGPHPSQPGKYVFYWYEMCDAVQAETYKIEGVEVSNFLLPLYFTGGDESGGRNDFLGQSHRGKTLVSFGLNPGGYVGYFNPETREDETISLKGDSEGAHRLDIKRKFRSGRRSVRYGRIAPAQAETAGRAAGPVRAAARAPRGEAVAPRPGPRPPEPEGVQILEAGGRRKP
jgi:hypothetical protein